MATNLKGLLAQCLAKNLLFDAALSAMGYTILGVAVRENPSLEDPARYRPDSNKTTSDPDAAARIRFEEEPLVQYANLNHLIDHADQLAVTAGEVWESALKAREQTVIFNSVRFAIKSSYSSGYTVYMIYGYINQNKGLDA